MFAIKDEQFFCDNLTIVEPVKESDYKLNIWRKSYLNLWIE